MFLKIGIIVLFAYSAWWLYTPMPEDMAHQYTVRISNVTLKAIFTASSLGEWLGFGNRINITRYLYGCLYKVIDTPNKMQIINTEFAGVPVRIYRYDSTDGGVDSAIVYYHGGGWVTGNLEMNERMLKLLGEKSKQTIVSVDYRLAPEYPFPIPLEDCVKATMHLFKHAASFAINPERIALMGDSAGGNLVATVLLKLIAQDHFPMPALQILIYPVVQIIDLSLPSHVTKSGVGVLSMSQMAYFMLLYLNISQKYAPIVQNNQHLSRVERARYEKDLNVWALPDKYKTTAICSIKAKGKPEDEPVDVVRNVDLEELSRKCQDQFVSPLLAEDLSQMPSAYVMTVGQDPLLSEGILYANKLEQSGVQVEWVNYQSSIHGIFSTDYDPNLDIALEHLTNYLKDNL